MSSSSSFPVLYKPQSQPTLIASSSRILSSSHTTIEIRHRLTKVAENSTPYDLRNTLISHTREAAQSYGNQGSKRICFSLKWGNLQS